MSMHMLACDGNENIVAGFCCVLPRMHRCLTWAFECCFVFLHRRKRVLGLALSGESMDQS